MPTLLDLFCGAGGCSVGYARAGFTVTGVDIEPHKTYPFEITVADAMDVLADRDYLNRFDVVHASPPCQAYSMSTKNAGTAHRHPDLLPKVRELLRLWGGHYVIENVPGAPMDDYAELCGSAFGLQVERHRWFESDLLLLGTPCGRRPGQVTYTVTGNGTPSWFRKRHGRNARMAELKAAMGIDWMSRSDLNQAIPPAYTQYLGEQLLAHLAVAHGA